MKPYKTADAVIVGIRWKNKPEKIATLLLGLYRDDGGLDYVGSAAVAASKHDRIAEQVRPPCSTRSRTAASRSRTAGAPATSRSRPVKPKLVAEVRYDKVQGNRFRHGTRFLRFRDDKEPKDCTWREVRPPRNPNDPTFESLLAAK